MPDVPLIASDSCWSVSPDVPRLTVCAVPLPTWMEMDPVSLSLALATALNRPVEFAVLVPADPE